MKKLLVVIVLIVAGYFGWQQYTKKSQPAPSPAPAVMPPQSAVDAAIDAPVDEVAISETVITETPLDAPAGAPVDELGQKIGAAETAGDQRLVWSLQLKRKLTPEQRNALLKNLAPYTEKLFSPAPSPESEFYTVQPGDSLTKIAGKFNIPYTFIMKINNLKDSTIRAGRRLKVPKGEVSIWVDKNAFWLGVFLDDYFVKGYNIGIGRHDKTPVGTFVVKDKLIDPTWYPPDGGEIPAGDPANELGTRWIGLEDTAEFTGYGIHGTIKPDTIGKSASNGCIRLVNEEVEELFDLIPNKARVVISAH